MVRYVVRRRQASTARVYWQQIKRGRTVIPHRVTKKKKQQNLLTAEEKQKKNKKKKQREGWSTGGKQALPVTRASRLMPSDRGKEKKSRNRTQYRGNYLKDNTDGKGKKEAEREKKGQGIVEKGKDVSKKWEERKDVDEEWQIKCKERGCGVKNGKM